MRVLHAALPWIVGLSACSPVLSTYGTYHGVSKNQNGTPLTRPWPHTGVDIRGELGDAVIASADGVVAAVPFSKLAGKAVIIRQRVPLDGRARWTKYIHLEHTFVERGDVVRRGDKIGTIGLFPYSGRVEHVHWMLCTNKDCSGPEPLDGTEDPLPHTRGCFSAKKFYNPDKFLLTYPVRC